MAWYCIASPCYWGATTLGQAGGRDRDQCKSPMALRRSTGGYKAEGDPSLSWLSSAAANLAAFSSVLSRTQQGSQTRRKPGSASPSPYPIPQADLKGKDFLNERVPKDEAGASSGVAQEELQVEKLHGRMEISISPFPDISLLPSRGLYPQPHSSLHYPARE